MENIKLSISVSDNGKTRQSIEVDLRSTDDNRHKPTISIKDTQADFSLVTELPASDYRTVAQGVKRFVDLKDPATVAKLTRALFTMRSWLSGGSK